MNRERVLIVEDDRAVARGLEYALSNEGYQVLRADTGQRGLDLVRNQEPHLILLDIRLPDMSGFQLCRRLRADGVRVPMLMLTACDEPVDKVLGLEIGADDYVVKPFDLRELISRIRALLRRAYGELASSTLGGRVLFGDVELDLERFQAYKQGQAVYLTPTEFRLLRFLVSHPRRPCGREELIEAVWGYASDIANNRTVDVHMRHLREKLEADPANPRWLVTVRGHGYVFQP